MPRKKTAADRARARERAKLEAEQLTGRSDLTHRQVADVLRAHRNGEDPRSVLSASAPDRRGQPSGHSSQSPGPSRRAPSTAATYPDHLIPVVPELHENMAPITIDGTEMIPVGTLIGGVNDYKHTRGDRCSVNVTTSIAYRHLAVDAAVMSRAFPLAIQLYEVPRSVIFGESGDEHDEHDEHEDRSDDDEPDDDDEWQLADEPDDEPE